MSNKDYVSRWDSPQIAEKSKSMKDDEHIYDVDITLEDKYIKDYEVTGASRFAFFVLGLMTLCGLRSFIVSKIAFHPPQLKGYEVVDNQFMYKNPFSSYDINDLLEQNNVGIKYNKIVNGTDQVASILLYRKPLDLNKQIILYSHGNNTDMGHSLPSYINLIFQTDANIITYDYSGYGYSNKKPTEKSMHKNIKMVYNFLTENLRINPLNIILFGHSIGTCASSYLISLRNIKVGGCILQSGLASGIKLLFPFQKRYLSWFDTFKNYEKLRKASILPVYIMHGKMDEHIPYYHSIILLNTLRKNFEKKYKKMKTLSHSPDKNVDIKSLITFWGIANSDHNNIELVNTDNFYRRLRAFLMFCKKYNRV
ncbi:alpha/beta hydrolase fold domain containing protein, putative [Plasmodium knowlesi strain H]|uniref:Alpha/beta hydrolase fold domain containing protein, putative n=3 Tax=Plasmodium knowlesi TaxID=5850 RepID=A0A5K1TZW4_PLAKH|nr:uncharacterized protein PKNH_0918100 [Plasmodium knowlesi strain H]OTN64955.1 putative Alpha/beta hydrolase fold domain containing protein [Plasmodium knowlesi]CAA9988228.1 alpha/beta hydrolase fold domain containing protein, putative [Plasmodium knowlesi strain H]SBO20156.1 alpha/beta hydrolase fold domain containing protein, putative [Plasmodium knowlesi strain H]SBO20535.1 alpha/beta hydrolase fold domain containing protein, putative [Plasmodium knowlesi strain H]VVS77702.1 alpha/beta hy|eukprot:XP_002259205.1 [Plasmodium knowlesi strain H]